MLSNLYKNKQNVKVFIQEYNIINVTLVWLLDLMVTSRTSRDGCVLSACSIIINNASLWKTWQATLLFYIMYVCVFICRNDSLLMTINNMKKKIIRLDVLVSMCDMSVRA